ncbi:MAG: hypothetical protein FD123_3960 [Bacteroidetes bacterium]|nr:MAG: hypothetical protein FD123_3960 [Bacteroidota bacterium]
MRSFLALFFLFFFSFFAPAQDNKPRVYLIPGQGSDGRIFGKMKIDSAFDTIHIRYSVPEKGETMKQFARTLSAQIDTTKPFSIVGVSLGGMLATEMSCFLKPERVIVISSAVSRSELPARYTFMKKIPLYRAFPAGLIKAGAFIAQPLVEPDRKKEKKIFKNMLRSKDKKFMKRSVDMIVRWKGPTEKSNCRVIHIHGNKDHTLPVRKVTADHVVGKGSHMMTLTRPEEISELVNKALKE